MLYEFGRAIHCHKVLLVDDDDAVRAMMWLRLNTRDLTLSLPQA